MTLDSTQYDFGSRFLLQMEDNKTYNISGCLLKYYELCASMLFYISFIFTWHLYCINMLIILIYGNYMYDYNFHFYSTLKYYGISLYFIYTC